MNSKRLLLVYGLTKEEKDFLSISRIEYIDIKPDMASCKIADIINGKAHMGTVTKLPDEEVILMDGYNQNEIMNMVKLIRAGIGKTPILAAVTENSSKWSFNYLLNHLVEEREWYRNNSKK